MEKHDEQKTHDTVEPSKEEEKENQVAPVDEMKADAAEETQVDASAEMKDTEVAALEEQEHPVEPLEPLDDKDKQGDSAMEPPMGGTTQEEKVFPDDPDALAVAPSDGDAEIDKPNQKAKDKKEKKENKKEKKTKETKEKTEKAKDAKNVDSAAKEKQKKEKEKEKQEEKPSKRKAIVESAAPSAPSSSSKPTGRQKRNADEAQASGTAKGKGKRKRQTDEDLALPGPVIPDCKLAICLIAFVVVD